jgi:glutamate racemase
MIGVFDSGVGGLSVLRALHARLPQVPLHYIADSAFAPYGDRTVDDVVQRSRRITAHLLSQGAQMIVVACNTATTAAIQSLRNEWPQLDFVGVEPGVKPAALMSRNGRIGVLATQRTIASERLRQLVERHASGCEVLLQPCPGLVDAIERADDDAVQGLLDRYCRPLQQAQVDTVVLGCTHYPFVADRIQAILGADVHLVDTAHAVAHRAAQLWPATREPAPPLAGQPARTHVRLEATARAERLSELALRWLEADAAACTVRV